MTEEIKAYLRSIRMLPEKKSYDRDDLCRAEFLRYREGNLSIYYAPFDHINREAQIVLVGITPGWTQMECAFRVVRNALNAGLNTSQALQEAKQEASFSGDMRVSLVRMLDGVGVPVIFGLKSSQDLFGRHRELLHTTSAVRYPVFVNGDNYTGKSPNLLRQTVLRKYVQEILANELQELQNALIIPLGRVADRVLDYLVVQGAVEDRRRLRGFPHPSGANVRRARQFDEERETLRSQLNNWTESAGKRIRLGEDLSTSYTASSVQAENLDHRNIEYRLSNNLPDESLYSRAFCFEHVSGDYLYPVRIRSRASGRTAFQVWDRKKSDTVEVEEEDMVRLVLHEDYAVRMKSPTTGIDGGYRRSGRSIVAVKLMAL